MKFRKIFIAAILFTFCLSAANLQIQAETLKTTLKAPQFTADEWQTELAKRRANVLDQMSDNSMLILLSAPSKIYTNDVSYHFRQENNFVYLTNLKQSRASLVLVKNGSDTKEILFIPKRVPQFEVWNGRRYSNEEASQISGIQTIVDANEFSDFINALRGKTAFTSKDKNISISNQAESIYLLSDGKGRPNPEFENEFEFAKTLTSYKVINALPIFASLRLVKSPMEIKIIQYAVDVTAEGAKRAMKYAGNLKWEYQAQAEIEYAFRMNNADYWGFPSIVAAGENATTLHYEESQAPLKKGELLLTDIGAEYNHYTADITRTFPISGMFSERQAEIYQIVYNAQEAVAAATKPGTNLVELNQIAVNSVKKDLAKLGLITAPEATFDAGGRQIEQYRLWYLHFFGHWLGMNVHDVGSISTPLKPGMIFTNEPGVYIRADALDRIPDTEENRAFLAKIKPAFEKYKNIGVRIEDDMLVTEKGVEWMSGGLPRSIKNIEWFMANSK